MRHGRDLTTLAMTSLVVVSSSTFIDPETRSAMGAQAVALAKAVDYSSAGQHVHECAYRVEN